MFFKFFNVLSNLVFKIRLSTRSTRPTGSGPTRPTGSGPTRHTGSRIAYGPTRSRTF